MVSHFVHLKVSLSAHLTVYRPYLSRAFPAVYRPGHQMVYRPGHQMVYHLAHQVVYPPGRPAACRPSSVACPQSQCPAVYRPVPVVCPLRRRPADYSAACRPWKEAYPRRHFQADCRGRYSLPVACRPPAACHHLAHLAPIPDGPVDPAVQLAPGGGRLPPPGRLFGGGGRQLGLLIGGRFTLMVL